MTRQPGDADRLRRIIQALADPLSDCEGLTGFERKAGGLAAKGLRTREIASRLRMTEDHAECALRSIARKTRMDKWGLTKHLIGRIREIVA